VLEGARGVNARLAGHRLRVPQGGQPG
jgi:hypothetical protein